MQLLTKGQKLQQAYRAHIEPYSKHLQFAVTLTLKQSALVRVKRFTNYGNDYYEFRQQLNQQTLNSTIKRFTKTFTSQIYGNYAKHKNKQSWACPLVLVAVEGRNTHKLTHLHLAIGNIPQSKHQHIEQHIRTAHERCDFANKEIFVKAIYDAQGWLGYITKEVGYTDNDALDIVSSTIPQFILDGICTESRLPAE